MELEAPVTLERWYDRVAVAHDQIVELYDERFYRLWQFYLAGAISAFRHDGDLVYQLQLTRRRDATPIVRDYMKRAEDLYAGDANDGDGLA